MLQPTFACMPLLSPGQSSPASSRFRAFSPLLEATRNCLLYMFFLIFLLSEQAEEWILVAAPVEGNFTTATSGGAGTVTHYILSAVPRNEIFEPVVGMADLIRDSTAQVNHTIRTPTAVVLVVRGTKLIFVQI